MADNETRVTYKAIADFTSLGRSVDKVRKKLAQLKAEEAALNSSSVSSGKRAAQARNESAKSVEKEAKAFEKEAAAVNKGATAAAAAVKAHQGLADATNQADTASNRLSNTVTRVAEAHNKAKAAAEGAAEGAKKVWVENDRIYTSTTRLVNGVETVSTAWRKATKSQIANAQAMSKTQNAMRQTITRAEQLKRGLDKVGNWRPRLTPPFIALIPIIGSVLALINPLVAGLGAVSAAGLGFGSSLASIAGSALAVVPALATLLGVVAALKTAFSGVGGVFKAYSAMKGASGGGGGGGGGAAPKALEISQTEKITRANEAYRRSIEDVQFASDDLDDARKDYIRRLRDLQKQVDRTAQSEARAAANSQLAKENYANTLADPGSTKGEKMDAQVGVDEAAADFADVVTENKQAADDLAQMKQKGMEGDREVIQAQRGLTDAINAQRDAQIALQNAQRGTTEAQGGAGGGAGAADKYAQALAKLSPSARAVVLALIAMEGEFTKMKQTVQEAFFSQFVGDIELLRKLFPPVTSMLANFATTMGVLADKLLLKVTSPEWLEDIDTFGKEAQPAVMNIGDGLLFLLDAFKDLALAALPFLTDLTEGFKNGAENLSELIGTARADGSLATWLEKVRNRMSQWWRIIKNIGGTLFNYGAATETFGKWLTDGFEKVTEGWLKSSEGAKEAGSPFQTYLEKIEPLLSNINGLLGDFFDWLAKTMGDEDNINQMNDLVTTIRDDLAPAISDILDTLSETGIGQSFVETITSIIETLDEILQNGGADAIKNFFEAVKSFFDVVKDIANIPGAGGVIVTIAQGLAGLAALSFIGKFTGLTSLFGWLIKLAKTKGMTGLLTKLGGLVGLKSLASAGGAGVAAAGGAAAAANAAGSAAGGVGGSTPVVYNTRAERKAAEKAAAKNTKILGGSLNKGVKSGIVGAVATIAGGAAADSIRSGASEGTDGAGARIGANALEGAVNGAAIGGTIGSVVPGVGTAVGATVGGVVGGSVSVLNSSQEDIDAFDKSVNESLSNLFTVKIPEIWNGFVGWVNDWANPINEWMTTPIDWSVLSDFFTVTVPGWWNTFSTWVGGWADPINEKVNTWIADQGKGISDFFTVTIPGWWTTFTGWVNGWGDPINTKVNTWIADRGKNLSNFFTVTVPGWWAGFVGWVNGWANPVNDKVNAFGRGAGQSLWDFFFVTIPGWWSDFKRNVNSWSNPINEKVNGWISSATTKVNNFVGSIGGGGKGKYNGGPILKRAGGGGVPGMRANSDTVPAMLTPGEFVVRKAVVNRIGMDNLTKLNAGVMSYSEMLQRAAKAKQDSDNVGMGGPMADMGGGMSFFNGGGPVQPPTFEPPKGGGPVTMGGEGGGMHFGDINIFNPKEETASDSLPRTIRKVAYLGSN